MIAVFFQNSETQLTRTLKTYKCFLFESFNKFQITSHERHSRLFPSFIFPCVIQIFSTSNNHIFFASCVLFFNRLLQNNLVSNNFFSTKLAFPHQIQTQLLYINTTLVSFPQTGSSIVSLISSNISCIFIVKGPSPLDFNHSSLQTNWPHKFF